MTAYKRRAKPSKENFLSWDAGESKDLVVLSEKGTEESVHWVGGESKECTGVGCPLCATLVKRTLRWTVQVKCEGEKIPWEMSNTTFFGVEDVAEMVGSLKGLRLRVTRHGTGMKTRYSVLPLTGKVPMTEEDHTVAWFVDEINDVCETYGLDPQQELKILLGDLRPELADAGTLVQMEALLAHVSEQAGLDPTRRPDEEETPSAASFFS